MATARRLYVYGVSAVSLLVLGVGLIQLLTVALGQVADALGASILSGDVSASLDQLSLAIALVVVGLPVWAIHWWLAERSVAGTGPDVTAERRSTIRAVHFLDVELVSLVAWLLASIWLVAWVLQAILGVEDGTWGLRPTDWIAIIAVAVAGWAYHARLRARDLRTERLVGAGAWVSRLYRHAGAFIGLVVAAFGAADAIAVVLGVIVGRPAFEGGSDWWRWPLADALARVLVGAVVFALHRLDLEWTIRDAEQIGEDDRWTRVRRTYFGAVLVTAAASVAFAAAASIQSLATWLLGVASSSDVARVVEDVVGPPLAILPWLAIAIWHLRGSVHEGATLDAATERSAQRVGGYLLSLVGLAFAAAGTARLLGLLLEATIGRPSLVGDDVWRLDLAQGVAFAIAGVVLWGWQWSAILGGWSRSDDERATTASRSYLYLAVGGGLLAAVPSAALVLYRLLNVVLATIPVARLGDEIATPLGVMVVAALAAAYHGRILLRDLRLARFVAPAVATTGEGASITVVLRGPTDADVAAVLDQLRERLPTGFSIETGARPLSPPGGDA
jgi:hypothetical protein